MSPMAMKPSFLLDPTHNIFLNDKNPLDAIFTPKTVAVIGATDKAGSVGRTILWNLLSSPFGGTVYPVNPKRKSVLGIPAFSSVQDIPEPIDLVVIVTPSATVPAIIDECASLGIPGAIIISAGFKEVGPEGVELERRILETAQRCGMRIVGPNCLGVMNPTIGLNATFASTVAKKGNVAFISQSGALCTAVLDWSFQANIGFSAFVSVGSMLDVDWGDLIYYLGDDPNTKSIVMYMESIGDARSFLSAAREVSLSKPIIAIKPGRTDEASKAAASHTGSMTGSDVILDTAFRRCGVLRVDSIEELFSMSEVLGKQEPPDGPNLTIITNAGGPGVLATDALIGNGGKLTELNADTIEALNQILPPQWSHNNPVDVLGDASPEIYAKTMEVVSQDPNSDAILVILTPQAMTDPTRTAELMVEASKNVKKPLLASWMGGRDTAAGEAILDRAGIPTFAYPDAAVKAFAYMAQHRKNLDMLYETPTMPLVPVSETEAMAAPDVSAYIQQARAEGRTILSEYEAKKVLETYGLPVTKTELAATVDEAVAHANAIGYPVVLKLHSNTITHKTDVGGIQLNLKSDASVRDAFEAIRESVSQKASAADFLGVTVQPMVKLDGTELIIGSSVDPQFGPVMVFGAGGQLVEVFQDITHGLPPLNTNLAARMVDNTRVSKVLNGYRGKAPVDRLALENLLMRFSQLIVAEPQIAEIEINPLIASAENLCALDARIILTEPGLTAADLPRPAIRPYPQAYTSIFENRQQKRYLVRPIRPEDETRMVAFHKSLKDETISLVYGEQVSLQVRTSHERLARICFNDYDREIALVAEALPVTDKAEEAPDIAAVIRLSKRRDIPSEGRFRMLVADPYQDQGLGKALLQRIISVAKEEGITHLKGLLSADNYKMKQMCLDFGFQISELEGQQDQLQAVLVLKK